MSEPRPGPNALPATPTQGTPDTPAGETRANPSPPPHGLRARTFGILPEESRTEWARHVAEVRAGYAPADVLEEKLVTAIAAAMWHEIRADRTLAETMAEIPPACPGRCHGTDLQEPAHARALGTAIRFMTAAGMATQRAQRAFHAHRKARRDGLIGPAAELAPPPANQNRTHDHEKTHVRTQAPARPARPSPPPRRVRTTARKRTCEPKRPPTCRPGSSRLFAGPAPCSAAEWDLVAAVRALRQPGAAPYRGPLDLAELERLLAPYPFDDAARAWLAGLRPRLSPG